MPDIDDLIFRWREGDQQAARLLYEQHRGRVYRLAYGLLNNAEDAEEVAQDALTQALMQIERYDAERARFSTWLHTITVNRVRDRQRRKRLPLLDLEGWQEQYGMLADEAPTPEGWYELNFDQEQVWQAVQQLSADLREALILRYWAGHTFQEMALILDCPLGTAQSRVRRGFERLRSLLSHLARH
jgi:RNA polymerase sigma-70 factor (ECF subfamily)